MIKTHRCLMILQCDNYSSEHIEECRKSNPNWRYASQDLPQFLYNERYNIISDTQAYLQFGSESQDQWLLFETKYFDPILQYEVSTYADEIEFFNHIGLGNFIKSNFEKTLVDKIRQMYISPSNPTHIIIEISYEYDQTFGSDYEPEVTYKIVGYLDNNMQLINTK